VEVVRKRNKKKKKSIQGRSCVVIRILWPVVPSNKERI